MMRIAVTGGSGKLGRTVVAVLRQAGHGVVNLDLTGQRWSGFVQVDLTNYGEVVDALFGENDPSAGTDQAATPAYDALVHLAAIPAPGILSDVATFHNNILSTFNVFQAARRAGIRNIVYASSETTLGLPFDVPPPYIPVDEEYPARPESVYSLVKHLEEQMAIELVRWDPTLKIIALRFSNVMDPEDYAEFPGFDADATLRKWNLWGYIDGRDGAQAVLKALELDPPVSTASSSPQPTLSCHGPTRSSSLRSSRRWPSPATSVSMTPCCRSTRRDGCSATTRSTPGADVPIVRAGESLRTPATHLPRMVKLRQNRARIRRAAHRPWGEERPDLRVGRARVGPVRL
jgi:nucleoside-diphosphate-sugar epimerase